MFLFVEDTIFNVKKIVTVEIDKEVLTQVNYYLSDGALLKEEMETEDDAKAKLTELSNQSSFIKVREDKLVNLIHIKNVKKDIINENTLVYTFYKGNDALVKERFDNEQKLNEKIELIKAQLNKVNAEENGEAEDKTN